MPRLSDPSPARGRLAWIHREAGKEDEAIEEMAAVVDETPWYLWGWNVLMDWMVKDKKWNMALRILNPCPAAVRSDRRFRQKRLEILGKAGLASEQLDAEWSNLLRDFPEEVSLHLIRYDFLRQKKRSREAAAVLTAVLPIDPDSPYVLARLTEVQAEEDKKEETIETLLRIWFAEQEPSTWPAAYAWKAAHDRRLHDQAYKEARRRLAQGSRPTPHALSIMAAHAIEREYLKKKPLQPHWRTWLPGPGAREVQALLRMVDRAPWADGGYRAELFRRLSELGYHRIVVRYWKRNRSVVEADVDSWAEMGRLLVILKRYVEARRLLSDWRERADARMWAVTNYVLCFSRHSREHLQEILRTCTDALASLAHDRTSKYLAHVKAETCALLNDADEFRRTWLSYRGYFTGELEEHEWFETRRKYLLSEIPQLGRLLDVNQTDQFQTGCKVLREKRSPTLIPSLPNKTGITGVPVWAWIFFLLALAGVIANLIKEAQP